MEKKYDERPSDGHFGIVAELGELGAVFMPQSPPHTNQIPLPLEDKEHNG